MFDFLEECKKIVAEYSCIEQAEFVYMKGDYWVLLKYKEDEYEADRLMLNMSGGDSRDIASRLKKLAQQTGTKLKVTKM